MDFLRIESSLDKKPEIYPVFLGQKSKDLMIRAKEFYAVWDEEHGLGVMMYRNKVVAMGGADMSFLTWVAEKDAIK